MTSIIHYVISHIETKQFAMFPDLYVNGKETMVNTAVQFRVVSDYSRIRNITKFSYYQDNNLLLVLELICDFEINPEATEDIKKDGKIDMNFLRYIASISVGTARGVIHSETKGSVLNPVILPPIDLTKLITGDMILKQA